MFRTKSRTEHLTAQVRDQSDSLAATATMLADQLRERVGPAVGQATESAMEWAKPRVGHGIEVAAPRLESAVNGLAPKVNIARDLIVDELIPRIAETISAWAATSNTAKDEALTRGQGAAAVISGRAVASRKGRKKRVLMILGLLGGAMAAAMAVMKKSAPKDDPWTTPLADSYDTTPNGLHAAAAPVGAAKPIPTAHPQTTVIDSLDNEGEATHQDSDQPAANNSAVGGDAIRDLADKTTNRKSAHKNGSDKNGTDKNQAP